jgi:hypothetical protein
MVSWSEHIPSWSMRWISIFGMGLFYSIQFISRPWRLPLLIWSSLVAKSPRTNLEVMLYCLFYRAIRRIGTDDESLVRT